MFSTFDLRLLLYVIRLAGWLKHCNLSLSLYQSSGHNFHITHLVMQVHGDDTVMCCIVVLKACITFAQPKWQDTHSQLGTTSKHLA